MTDEEIKELYERNLKGSDEAFDPIVFGRLIAAAECGRCIELCEAGMDISVDANNSEWSRAHNSACRGRVSALTERLYLIRARAMRLRPNNESERGEK